MQGGLLHVLTITFARGWKACSVLGIRGLKDAACCDALLQQA